MFFTNKKIYKNGDNYYAMVHPPYTPINRFLEIHPHYALWTPVKKFWFMWIRNGEDFYLDTNGFEPLL